MTKVKSLALVLLIVLTAFALIGCNNSKEPEMTAPAVTEYPTVNAVYMLSVFKLTADNTMERAGRIDVGTEMIDLDNEVDIEDVAYKEIRTEEFGDVYTYAAYVMPNGVMGVVIKDDAVLYSEPKIDKPTSYIVPRQTILVVSPQADNGFYEVVGWDFTVSGGKRVGPGYLETKNVSTKEADWFTAVLLYKASINENSVTKSALLRSAKDNYPVSVFKDEVLNALKDLEEPVISATDSEVVSDAKGAGEVDMEMVSVSPTPAKVNDSSEKSLNVRSLPSTSGSVVGSLEPGDDITINGQSPGQDTIGGNTDYWYHISAPMEGWVFGSFLVTE